MSDPPEDSPGLWMAESAVNLGLMAGAAYSKQKYDLAVALLDQAIELEPNNATLHYERAQSLGEMKRVDEAFASLERAIQLRSDWAAPHIERAALLQRIDRLDEAWESCKRALALEPNNVDYKRVSSDLENALKAVKGKQRKVQGLSDDFDCVLCYRLFYEPVTTPCGHTFCKPCLLRALDHGVSCPMCRSILYVASDYPVTIALKAIIERNFPEESAEFVDHITDVRRYERRRQEAELEKLQSEVGMPLFVLNAVVFPKLEFPMHIFEPRYRLMLRRCLEGQKRFGLLGCRRGPDGRWVPAAVGCILKITDHRALPDGRSYVNCVGTRRFRVLEQWDQDGYLCGRVQYFDDEPLATDEAKHEFRAVAEETRTKLSDALARVPAGVSQRLQHLLARAGDIPANDVDFGFWLSAYIPIGQAVQQELLEMTNPIERMKRLSAHLTPSSADQCITM